LCPTSRTSKIYDFSFISNRLLQAEGIEIFANTACEKILDPSKQSLWSDNYFISEYTIPKKIISFLKTPKITLNTDRFYEKIKIKDHQKQRIKGNNLFSLLPTEILVEIFSYLVYNAKLLAELKTVCRDFYYCISELLTKNRLNVFGYCDAFDTTSLHMAVWHEEPGLVLLIAAKCPELINSTDGFHETPLHIAMQVANPALVLLLLKFGGDPLIENCFGKSPLKLALEWKNDMVIDNLIIRNFISLKSLGKLTLDRLQRLEAAKVKFNKKRNNNLINL